MFRKFSLKILVVDISMLALLFTIRSIAIAEKVEPQETVNIQVKQTKLPQRTSTIHEEIPSYTPISESEIEFSPEEEQILLQVGMAEAESEGIEGMALVMLVVLNRVKCEEFPDNIKDVVFQVKPERQFSVTAEGGRYYTTSPNDECKEALELVKSGWDKSEGALYFESCKGDSWHSRNLDLLFSHERLNFYK